MILKVVLFCTQNYKNTPEAKLEVVLFRTQNYKNNSEVTELVIGKNNLGRDLALLDISTDGFKTDFWENPS